MEIKNPFSLYDFLGYFFPGASFVFLLIFFLSITGIKEKIPLYNYLSYRNFKVCLYQVDKVSAKPQNKRINLKKDYIYDTIVTENRGNNTVNIDILVLLLPFVLISYITGHLISYLSSQTIEYFSNRAYGYPSEYLLSRGNPHVYKKYFCSLFRNGFSLYLIGPLLWRMLILIIFLPISIFVFILGKVFNINKFITRGLDEYLITIIESKIYNLSNLLHVQNPPINLKFDFHRIILHFVYLHQPDSQRKTDNYIALYGFLRSITFIGCIYFDMLLCVCLAGKVSIDNTSILCVGILCALTIVSFMAYIKFYRRYTLENYMTLLSYEKLKGYIYKDDNM